MNEIEYTDAPVEIAESLKNAAIVANFDPTPENVGLLSTVKNKRRVNTYLSVETIDKFKNAAKKDGGRYQTMISDVLDTYTRQNM